MSWILLPLILILLIAGAVILAVGCYRIRLRKLDPIAGVHGPLIDNMPDGIIVVDSQNCIVDINSAALRLLSREREALQGQPFQTALEPWKGLVELAIDARQAQAELITHDIPPRTLDLRITPLVDSEARPAGRLVVMRDITGLKQAEDSLNQRITELTTINSITQTLAEQMQLAKMIQAAGDRVRQILNAQGFYIALYDPQLKIITFPYWRSMIKQFDIPPVAYGKGLASHVIETRAPLVINQNYETRSAELGVIRPLHPKPLGLPLSWLGVPMIVGDQAIGMISAQNFDQENAFSETDLQLWTTIAAALGTAIRNAQLYTQTQRAAEQMTALNQLSLAIIEGLGMDRLLPTLHQQCQKIAPIDIFYVVLVDQATRQNRFVYYDEHGRSRSLSSADLEVTAGLNAQIIETRQTLYIADTFDAGQAASLPVTNTSGEVARTFLGVPLILREQVVGVISMQNDTEKAFTPQQIDLFEMFAVQAAIVVQNSQLYEQVQTLAITDELTGLPNRRALFEKGAYEILRARRFNHPLSVIMFDIDHFKQVNDRYGHPAGDHVLRLIADLLRDCVRATDLPARYGGEEFVVLLPETSDLLVSQIAERLRAQIAGLAVPNGSEVLRVTVSLGVASLSQETPDFSKLISHADQALYQSKRDGRNRITVWNGR